MKRFAVALLILLVGVPWSAVPAMSGPGCAMSKAAMAAMGTAATATAKSVCGYCAARPAVSAASIASPDVPRLGAGCCRFRAKAEGVVAQAGSLGASPKPLQSPDHAAALAPTALSTLPTRAITRSGDRAGVSPPHAPPTRTTHLLL